MTQKVLKEVGRWEREFKEDQMDHCWAASEWRGEGKRECVYIIKWLFTCFNILTRDAGFSTGFIADLYWIHHPCFQLRHIHFHFLCLQVLYNLFALEHLDLESMVQSRSDTPGHFKTAAADAEDSVVSNCRGICCSPRKSHQRKSNIQSLKYCAIVNPLQTSTLTINREISSLYYIRTEPSPLTLQGLLIYEPSH